MSRPKTISDEAVLDIAKEIFRHRGHSATTREIAEAAGVSEAILYQRFGSKDDLFFASMRPTSPDLAELLGPEESGDDAHAFVRKVVVRIARYFAGIIPLALHVTTHPSFKPSTFARNQPMPSAVIREGLALRLKALADRRQLSLKSADVTARLLVSLAHDWALGNVLHHQATARPDRELKEMVDVIWDGLQVRS